MDHIDDEDLQFPDAGSGERSDERHDDLTSFDSSTLLFPPVGDVDVPLPPEQPAAPKTPRHDGKPEVEARQSEPTAVIGGDHPGDGFDLPVWGAGDAHATAADDDEPTQLFTPAAATQRATTTMPAVDETSAERTQLIPPDAPARTVVNDVNETYTVVPGSEPPVAFAPMDTDGDDAGAGSGGHGDKAPEHAAAAAGGNGRRTKIIIGVVAAVVVIALIVVGVVLWQRSRSTNEKNAAVASCERARTALQTAYTNLDEQVSQTKSLTSTTESAVADAATLRAFQSSTGTASELQQQKDQIVVECSASDSREQLEQYAQRMDEQLDDVENATKQLKTDADALTASRDAKSTQNLKDDLNKAIDDAQAVYDESANAVADEQTRTDLQQAIDDAKAVAGKASLDQTAVNDAKQKLTDAVTAVRDSESALTAANEAAAQEALRQQQLAQQQAQQQAPGDGTTGGAAGTDTTGGTSTDTTTDTTGTGVAGGDGTSAGTGANTVPDTGITQ